MATRSARKPDAENGVKRSRREHEPLQVNLSVAVRFGEEEDERVVLMDEQEMRMVGSIFRYRDKIARFMVSGLLKAAMLQPKVAAIIFPKLKGR